MQTMNEMYLDIYKNKEHLWKYYSELKLRYPFTTQYDVDDFIRGYLYFSEKGELYKDIELTNLRKQHTVSVFFLGIMLLIKLEKFYRIEIKDFVYNVKINIKNDFSFFWFLSCLYHDIGYYYEDRLHFNGNFSGLINSVKHKIDLSKDLLIPFDLLQSAPRYFEAINKNDHGIIGGIYLFNEIMKLYERKNINNNQRASINGLVLDKSFIKVFESISRTIIVHNIWYCLDAPKNAEKIASYKKLELDKLIIKDQPIFFNKHPFLYILCLADTIDPVKIIMKSKENEGLLTEIDVIDILNCVKINYKSKNLIEISTSKLDYFNALNAKFRKKYQRRSIDHESTYKWLGVDIVTLLT